ncbi:MULTISPECIES: SDR family NAD(P)-dependent oxidoreductase [Tsukamurella]|uniref:SDR family oxidoreductase n=2 Tax=Tsukamurella TaxID=2060 RepID=A0A5C5S3N7_9ACTN|nr:MULTISPECIES: SDR family oxidoreductase [Tsukamurella]NMD57663.1 SDR family oxidoreductase [Tsukamurella columbiensis]TWS29085.1 SDR family oxidoreductase [Tsukamurella conjunctivitidis]
MANGLFDLTGTTAVVTGGNGGIGFGLAGGLLDAGANVSVWGRSAAKNAAVTEAFTDFGDRFHVVACDVSDRVQVEAAFAATLARFGRVDGMFANAGRAATPRPFHEIGEQQFDEVFATNLKGSLFCLQVAAAHMRERAQAGDPFGRLVVTSSLGSMSGMARAEDYAATKGAVESVIHALAVEYGRYGVTANAVVPGWIETEMTEKSLSDERLAEAVSSRIPARRLGAPADFAGIAVYLMSRASSYHSGDHLVIDGAYHRF